MKKDLILLHGALGSKKQLSALAVTLEEDYRVHTFDFSGHGGREFHPSGYTFDVFSDDIRQYMKKNHIGEAGLFGYSMGGYAALYFTSLYPEQVSCVFTFGTKFKWDKESTAKQTAMLDPVKIEAKVPKFAGYLEALHAPNDWREVLSRTAEMMNRLSDESGYGHEKINASGKKILLGIGDGDDVSSIEETLEARSLLRGSQMLVLPATAHPLEKIDAGLLAFHIRHFFYKE